MKKHCNETMIGIEYWYDHPGRYDGISEWKCKKCGIRFGRWTGKELKGDEYEKPFGYKDEPYDEFSN